MNVNQTVIQSPNPKVIIKRLKITNAGKTKTDYDEITKIAIELINSGIIGHDARRAWLAVRHPNVNYETVRAKINSVGGKVELFEKTEVPEEPIYGTDEDTKLTFSLDKQTQLQSYQFSLSKSDVNGSFSLTFFPDKIGEQTIFDKIQILDIVEIYENRIENGSSLLSAFNPSRRKNNPVFIGVVKSKKYVAQVTDGGIVRRLQVSGISAAGLISQFYLNLDSTAMILTKQVKETTNLRTKLTAEIAGENKPIKEVITKAWDFFCNLAETNGTVAIKTLIDGTNISGIFDCDNSPIYYPFANLALGEQTQDFYSLIGGLTPEPIYERFATMDYDSGKMKIVIRQVPFRDEGAADVYQNSKGKSVNWNGVFNRDLRSNEVKAIDLTVSDKEVYTVFFSYLNGYPIENDKLMKLIALEDEKGNPMLTFDDKKYQTYGYRPLIATFNGYDKSKKANDKDTESNLAKINKNMREWFGNLDRMMSGSITLAMTYNDDRPIMPGEVIGFLGGQFYVEGISHSWNYGQGGDINLSVSRGGDYDKGGKFHPFNGISEKINLLENRKEKA